MKSCLFGDLVGTFFFSLFGFMVSWLLGLIPWVGVFLALFAQFLLGVGLGYVVIPLWSRTLVICATLGGFFFGLDHGSYSEGYLGPRTYVVTLFALALIVWGYVIGDKRATADDERDSAFD